MVLLAIALVAGALVVGGLCGLVPSSRINERTPIVSASLREAEANLIVMRTELAMLTEFLRELDAS